MFKATLSTVSIRIALFLVLVGSLATPNPVEASASILFVNSSAVGANNGTSWLNAYTNLQSALAAAPSGSEIWVAAGTYKPTSGTDRTISFALKNGVAIYGGFAGIETIRTQRNPATNISVLSGEIGSVGVADNSYHVVMGGGQVTQPYWMVLRSPPGMPTARDLMFLRIKEVACTMRTAVRA